jgi:hypothetical protein
MSYFTEADIPKPFLRYSSLNELDREGAWGGCEPSLADQLFALWR